MVIALLACASARTDGGTLEGLCEASAIVPWKGGFLVGDNETPDRLFAFTAELAPAGIVPLASPIDDIEALALADPLWVVGSQSTNKDAEARPLRERIGVLGAIPSAPDLAFCAPCVAARGRSPQAGGLNVEGAMVRDGSLWLGLRAPLDAGRAILLDLSGRRALSLDLGGLGVRDLVPAGSGFYVIAGPVRDEPAGHELWWFDAPDAPGRRLDVSLPPSTEGMAFAADGSAIVVTDGDGKTGSRCATPATWMRVALPAR